MVKRFLCLFAAFIALFWCVAPAFATGVTPGVGVGGLPVGVEIQLDVVDFAEFCRNDLRYVYNSVRHWLDDDICPYAPQASGGHNFVPRRTMVDGQIGKYYVCEYCGKAYGDALEEAYDEYVETLPGQKVNSDGSFLWFPSASDCSSTIPFIVSSDFKCSGSLSSDGTRLVDQRVGVTHGGSGLWYASGYADSGGHIVLNAWCLFNGSRSSTNCALTAFSFTVPFDASYTLVSSGFSSFSSVLVAGSVCNLGYSSWATGTLDLAWPTFEVMPLERPSGFVPDTRVSGGNVSDSGTGSYGYVQDGQLYQSTVGTIYNETTNIYQNPVTGETADVTNWTYDYSDRSYTLTTDEGEMVTITYGDTSVTINDGGTTYNVYYLTEHDESVPEHYYTSSVTLAPTCTGAGVRTYTCDDCGDTYTETIPATGHDYQSSITLAPTCVNTGVRTFTCSVCGDTYTVSMPSTGHVWHVVQTVPTVYDESGQLVTEGYTIYQCATCGEQYKITADSGGASLPSPGGGGTSTDTGASLIELDPHVGRGFLATIAHGLTEDLPEVLKAASAWFTEFPAFYGGFTAFLKDGIAGCLPDIPRKTMGFGLSMVTFIGIVKKIIGR